MGANTEKIILPEAVELEKITIEVFQKKDRHPHDTIQYWVSEEKARNHLATHILCPECSNVMRNRSYCNPCAEKKAHENYLKMPFKEWDGITPVCIHFGNEFFFSPESIDDYLTENDIDPKDLNLVICSPNHLFEIDDSYFADVIPENRDSLADCNKEVSAKIDELNEFIKKQPPISWGEGMYRTIYKREA